MILFKLFLTLVVTILLSLALIFGGRRINERAEGDSEEQLGSILELVGTVVLITSTILFIILILVSIWTIGV